MDIQKTKMLVSSVWMLVALVIAINAAVPWPVHFAIAAIGLLPPLALLMWWNDPSETLSETINKARK